MRKRRSPNASTIASRSAGISVRLGDRNELRRRPLEPDGEVADLLDRDVLEAGVHPRVLRVPVDVEAVVDVTVGRVPERREHGDRLTGGLERDRLVEDELPSPRVDHRGALITDGEVGDARFLEVGADGAPHPPGGDDHRDPGRLRARDRRPGARMQQRVAADEGAVEVAGECLDVAREGGGRISRRWPASRTQPRPRSAGRSSWPANGGIAPMPFVTRVTTSSVSGFASSRFGPTVPVAPASASVWQPTQPALMKTALPAVGSPVSFSAGRSLVSVVAVGSVPTTVSGVAVVSVPSRQPAPSRPSPSASNRRATMCVRRITA